MNLILFAFYKSVKSEEESIENLMGIIMKKFFIIAVAVFVVLVAGIFGVLSIATYKPTVAFYKLNEKTVEALKSEMASMTKENGKSLKFVYEVLDPDEPMSSQKGAKKAALIFAALDADVEEYAKTSSKVVAQKETVIGNTPSTTRETAVTGKKGVLAVPLLYDFYIVDINRSLFEQSGLNTLAVIDDLKAFSEWSNENKDAPLMFPGKEDDGMVDFLGAYTEAVYGSAVLEAASEKLYSAFKSDYKAKDEKYTSLTQVAEELIAEDGLLNPAMTEIRKMVSNKSIGGTSFFMNETDFVFFMEGAYVCAMGNNLSQHRLIEHKKANVFSSVYFPGKTLNSDRKFQALSVCAIAQSKDKSISSVINLLVSSRQSNLSLKTELAPVDSSCSASDRQGDDVRYWLAASEGPVMPLSQSVPSKDALAVVAEIFRRNASAPIIE